MKTFNDNADHKWTVAINVDTVKRVKARTGTDLLKAIEGELLERLAADPVLLCDVIYAVCETEVSAAGVSEEDFGRAMAGDAIDAATTALLEELVDFFPSRRRAVFKKALEKMQKLEGMALTAAAAALDSDKLEKVMQSELDQVESKTFGDSSGNSPASQE